MFFPLALVLEPSQGGGVLFLALLPYTSPSPSSGIAGMCQHTQLALFFINVEMYFTSTSGCQKHKKNGSL